jgi:hypothetical protein
MGDSEHRARRVAAHERAEQTHRRAAKTHQRAARQASAVGALERADREPQLAQPQLEGAALQHERACQAKAGA